MAGKAGNGEETEKLRTQLIALIRKLSYREGKFKLASGKESTFYVDMKNVALHPDGASLIGKLVWKVLGGRGTHIGAVGGPTLGADPLSTAVSLAALDLGRKIPAFIIRKEPKSHGTSQWIEGREIMPQGAECLVLEDVVTTGGSSLKSIEKLRAEGFKVSVLVSVLDRDEGAGEALRAAGVELVSLTRIDEIRKAR